MSGRCNNCGCNNNWDNRLREAYDAGFRAGKRYGFEEGYAQGRESAQNDDSNSCNGCNNCGCGCR